MMHKNEEGKKAAVINLVDNLLHKNAVKERDNDVLFRTFSGKNWTKITASFWQFCMSLLSFSVNEPK